MSLRFLPWSFALALLVGCSTVSAPHVQRKGNLSPTSEAGRAADVTADAARDAQGAPQAVIRRGTGTMINREAARAPAPALHGASTGEATFNFEGESLHAVVKAILGDMLGQNYVIAPGVQGTVTLATPKPVSPAQALNLLEMVLGWNNARMVYSGGRYNIVAADQALAGTVAPSTAPAASARGFEVRVVPLQFISATEMKKVLEPYARPNAIVNVDSGRNVITLGGTRAELENYMRTVEIFDVDWLSGMSVGVFPIQSGKAEQVAADLEKVFGEESKTPSAGMFRFLPLENANAVLVITPQVRYLDQIQQWLDRIDTAGGSARLFSYELRYIKARDLAERLSEAFASSGNRGGSSPASLAPGAMPSQLGSDSDRGMDSTNNNSSSFGSVPGSSSSGGGNGSMNLPQRQSGNVSVSLEVEGDRVGVSAVEETNTLLVRSTPQAWRSIREVIEKLDVMPLQVHIEAQVAEVSLDGDLKYGVNWFFDNAVAGRALTGALGGVTLPAAAGGSWSSFAGAATGGEGLGWAFTGHNGAAVVSALDKVTDVRLLQTPSVFVRNNAEATLNVGDKVPINTTTVNTGIGTSSYSSVQYIDTGVILKVRPRVTRDGTVFLDIVQEVSSASNVPDNCNPTERNCNPRISTKKLSTEAAVQSGDTIMLAGLITDSGTDGSSGIPGLSRIPVVGALFGQKSRSSRRSEVIVLLTPSIVRNSLEARNLTDEYSQRFRAMEPLNQPRAKK
ncbi:MULTISPECIES: type II secretion system secretin GspD [unclassified Stenotrophomonas]|uniref:Type II secretion system secretin GspD n=1 Tax=Stenotrophomonas hibiscicola TaxID=86189 RepID=A0ABV0CC69_9GAMM|nr:MULTISPECIES: type II secretion system secretin GspD [unclassified Stenotrophomonas]MBA0329527.1 type II secretion system protein GspD [Stenotrophomonas maltophilia]MBN7850833.1 type II secretion system secretin GspD [Stenotrophomonas maltophilia]MCM2526330.1 type II secretion system secretin GspD [Stenotrophomonas maltophilia]MCU1088252.1 type II secretion system secretin GspD [Stenotrophomonas maltophilia]MDH1193875.1 type II secretion system secretin GspD [Stenotrophomonas sp. GD03958]